MAMSNEELNQFLKEQSKKKRRETNKIILIAVGIPVTFVLLSLVFGGWEDSEEEDVKKPIVYTEIQALIQSRQFVEKRLKAPATAKWCSDTDGVVRVNDSTFLVNSCVDSQNAFGALLRSNYQCKITFWTSTDQVQVSDLLIE